LELRLCSDSGFPFTLDLLVESGRTVFRRAQRIVHEGERLFC
jgi:hypothetical protein